MGTETGCQSTHRLPGYNAPGYNAPGYDMQGYDMQGYDLRDGAARLVAEARTHVHEAECALHIARQTRVDTWIAAAADRLHEALCALGRADQNLSMRAAGQSVA